MPAEQDEDQGGDLDPVMPVDGFEEEKSVSGAATEQSYNTATLRYMFAIFVFRHQAMKRLHREYEEGKKKGKYINEESMYYSYFIFVIV
jgi:hypothetical protein